MSEPLTASGAAKLAEMMAETIAVRDFLEWVPDGYEDKALAHIEVLRRTAAARAADEALSVERVAEALMVALRREDHPRGYVPRTGAMYDSLAAALVAHLRGPR